MNKKVIFNLLKWGSFCVFFGRAWQLFFWEVPIRSVLWNEDLLSPLVNFFGYTWDHYASSSLIDTLVNEAVTFWGFLLFIVAIHMLREKSESFFAKSIFVFGILSLFSFSTFYTLDSNLHIGQFIEYGGQMLIPLLYYMALRNSEESFSFEKLLRLAVACTFVGHGLYAIGFHPVPGNFLEMCMEVLGLSEDNSFRMLKIAGTMDMFIGISMLMTLNKHNLFQRYFLILAFMWGLATTLARPFSYFDLNNILESFWMWTGEVAVRVPHFVLPLVALLKQSRYQPYVNHVAEPRPQNC